MTVVRHISSFLTWKKKKIGLNNPVLVNSIPKSGTHLLSNILGATPGARGTVEVVNADKIMDDKDRLNFLKEKLGDLTNGKVIIGHIPYSPIISEWLMENHIKSLFIYRDPRDITVSLYHYIMKNPKHFYYPVCAGMADDSERLMAMITGYGRGKNEYLLESGSITNIKDFCEVYLGWLGEPITYSIKFEDIINRDKNFLPVWQLFQFLGLDLTEQQAKQILQKGIDPSQSSTFRKGKTNAWKDEYQQIHQEAFSEIGNGLLQKMGYI